MQAGSIFDVTPSKKHLPRWQRQSIAILDSLSFLLFSTAVTLVAIFESDLRLAATPAAADGFFTVLASLVFVEFMAELVS